MLVRRRVVLGVRAAEAGAVTPAEVRRAIAATPLDAPTVAFLDRVGRFARADMRAHGVRLGPQLVAFFHACGHTSWADYSGPGHKGGACAAAVGMLSRYWSATAGGVSAPCPTCLPKRCRRARPPARKGPAWRQDPPAETSKGGGAA